MRLGPFAAARSAIVGIAVLCSLLGVSAGLAACGAARTVGTPASAETKAYIAGLDLARARRLGRDFSNPRYAPGRLGKPISEIDTTFDYDFARLRAVTARLQGVDRRAALQAIFARVTQGARSDTDRHLAVVRFVQEVSFHSTWLQPMYRDKQAVFDPLVLLALNEMRCGQASRLGADLFLAAGYPARIAQVGAHVLAEIRYDGDWHFFDADIFDAGEVARDADGSIPSLAELSRRPRLLDRLAAYAGFNPQTHSWVGLGGGHLSGSFPYPASYYFSRRGYGGLEPVDYVKTATDERAQQSRYYGWNYWTTTPNTALHLNYEAVRYQPGAPLWRSVRLRHVDRRTVELALGWYPALDGDGDLAGYRVSVGTRSRGWQLDRLVSDRRVAPYVRGVDWRPEEYDAIARPLPADAAAVRTASRSARIRLPAGRTYFVSVTGLDRYGLRIGKQAYFAAEELTIRT